MSEYYQLYGHKPDYNQLKEITEALKKGALIAYPTDSGYALGCCMDNAAARKRIRLIRELDDTHNFTLICRDLAELGRYAKVTNPIYRMIKRVTPGGYTFILKATSDVPKLMMHANKRTIGIRIPDHPVALSIAGELGEPLITSTLILPGEDRALAYADAVVDSISNDVDIIIDGGYAGDEPTTVIDCASDAIGVLREGSGDVSAVR